MKTVLKQATVKHFTGLFIHNAHPEGEDGDQQYKQVAQGSQGRGYEPCGALYVFVH